ncbi:hypothetical protein B0H14DRAFT_2591181 [Mycena olivaceomarginata]|nr:hypothetical protein B0H14DRAFT_2591181 [Mycena olivaceomarginata]
MRISDPLLLTSTFLALFCSLVAGRCYVARCLLAISRWASCSCPPCRVSLAKTMALQLNADIWLEILKNNTCYSDPSQRPPIYLSPIQPYYTSSHIPTCQPYFLPSRYKLTFDLKGDTEAETDYYVSESDSDYGDTSDSGDEDNRRFAREERLTRAQEEGEASDSGDKDHRVQEEGGEKSPSLEPECVLSDHNTAMDQDSDTDSVDFEYPTESIEAGGAVLGQKSTHLFTTGSCLLIGPGGGADDPQVHDAMPVFALIERLPRTWRAFA